MLTLSKLAENFNIHEYFSGDVKTGELLSDHTTFKVGGPAALYLAPEDTASLLYALQQCEDNGYTPFILGGGSNLVVSDSGIDGVVISLGKMRSVELCSEKPDEDGRYYLRCNGGTPISEVTGFCTKNGFSGLETFSGLPGTIGGACFMNARCYEVQVSDVLVRAEYVPLVLKGSRTIQEYILQKEDWDYKRSPFAEGLAPAVVTSVVLAVKRGNREEIAAKCEGYRKDRIEKGHFKYPSAGSVFKNNHAFGKPSGRIIDECGLKGTAVGGAQVAPWHGNFIINTGTATAADIQQLVVLIQEKVREKTGFELEPEILFI